MRRKQMYQMLVCKEHKKRIPHTDSKRCRGREGCEAVRCNRDAEWVIYFEPFSPSPNYPIPNRYIEK